MVNGISVRIQERDLSIAFTEFFHPGIGFSSTTWAMGVLFYAALQAIVMGITWRDSHWPSIISGIFILICNFLIFMFIKNILIMIILH